MKKIILLTLSICYCAFEGHAQQIAPKDRKDIEKQRSNLRAAHLESNTTIAASVYHNDLILVSQSGKRYGKKEALANLKNKFVHYENAAITFLKISKRVILTNYIN